MTEKEILQLFPAFEKELASEIVNVGEVKTLAAGDVLMRTGQNIRSAILVLDGLVKIYREDEEGNDDDADPCGNGGFASENFHLASLLTSVCAGAD